MIISNKNIGIRFVDYVFFDVDFKPDNIFGYVLGILFALICLPFSFIHFRLNDYTFKKRNWALLYHNLIAHSFILCVIFTDWLNTFMISIKGTKLYDFIAIIACGYIVTSVILIGILIWHLIDINWFKITYKD